MVAEEVGALRWSWSWMETRPPSKGWLCCCYADTGPCCSAGGILPGCWGGSWWCAACPHTRSFGSCCLPFSWQCHSVAWGRLVLQAAT